MGCAQYSELPGCPSCCDSCHDDFEDLGYDLCTDPITGRDDVCCAVSIWLKAVKKQADSLGARAALTADLMDQNFRNECEALIDSLKANRSTCKSTGT